ncbi:MAG: hypothetical protein ACODAJ_02775 [Planctomycetota bacterium]
MRHIALTLVLALAAGCSSDQPPEPPKPLKAGEAGSMPLITFDEVQQRLAERDDKALLIVLWRAEDEGAGDLLETADALESRHAEAGLEVLALNINMADGVRQRALPLVQELDLDSLTVRAYQDDVMGLGASLDPAWGGQTPAAFLFTRAGDRLFKGHGRDALEGAAARIPAAVGKR